jgi:hypothetical protein
MYNFINFQCPTLQKVVVHWFSQTSYAWWWFPALILAPDIGMLGYVAGPKTGAFTYNLFHHKGIALVVLLLGWQLSNDWVVLAGIVIFGHSSLDRMLGYGLKYSDGFKHTHLGRLD